MPELRAKRLRREPDVYNFPGKDLYTISHIDDILAFRVRDSTGWFVGELPQLLPTKHLGERGPCGKGTFPVLRRALQRDDSGIHL